MLCVSTVIVLCLVPPAGRLKQTTWSLLSFAKIDPTPRVAGVAISRTELAVLSVASAKICHRSTRMLQEVSWHLDGAVVCCGAGSRRCALTMMYTIFPRPIASVSAHSTCCKRHSRINSPIKRARFRDERVGVPRILSFSPLKTLIWQ
ncbi:uncharacterized protein J3D65DRAFT_72308 [Phyllosticta citribraziliensis]|uniref:Secreted protein n=1 Tax=Phyllosticta citribraziliensis TaxID=989973 RepID=A0ABR1LER6_9PEZI